MTRPSPFSPSVLGALAVVALLGSTACSSEPRTAKKPEVLTRAGAAELIVKARDGDAFTFPPEAFFTDVPASDPRFKYVQQCRVDKLTIGLNGNPTLFGPNEAVTRYMLASFVVRARFGEDFDYPAEALFVDVPASHANFKYVQKAVSDGILTGCGKGIFCPNKTVTPAEARKVVDAVFPAKS